MSHLFFQKTSSERPWFICSNVFSTSGLPANLHDIAKCSADFGRIPRKKPTNTSASSAQKSPAPAQRRSSSPNAHSSDWQPVEVIFFSDFSVLYLFVFQGKHRDEKLHPLLAQPEMKRKIMENWWKLLWQLMQWEKGVYFSGSTTLPKQHQNQAQDLYIPSAHHSPWIYLDKFNSYHEDLHLGVLESV